MTETHETFLLYAGDTWQFDAQLHSSGDTPLDLTGAAVEWQLRNAQTPVLTLGIGSGITVTDATGGLCHIVVTTAQTTPLIDGIYNDDIRVTLADGVVTTQAVGQIGVARIGSQRPPTYDDPCATLAVLHKARLDLLTGQRQVSVSMENFSVTYSDKSDMPALDAAISRYETLCGNAQGKKPRRFAMRAGAMLRPGGFYRG